MEEERRIGILELVTRAYALCGLAVSSLLFRDYVAAEPVFCGAGGGCDVVRHSKYAHLLGVPTPAFGLAFFIAVLVLLCWPTDGARRLLRMVAIPGALAGVGLLGIQLFALHALCKFCFIADVVGIGLLPLVLLARTVPPRGSSWMPFAMAAVVALVLPTIVAGKTTKAPPRSKYAGGVYQETLPAPIAAAEQPGTPTIVEFIDFECPYCRKEAASLRKLLATRPTVKIVRKMTPLPPDMHPHALDAARAWCCADEAGKGDAMADALMTTDVDDLTPSHCAKVAAQVGVDPAAYQACLASDRPAKRMAADDADAKVANVPGLPTFWVGHTRFVGLQEDDVVTVALDKAIADAH